MWTGREVFRALVQNFRTLFGADGMHGTLQRSTESYEMFTRSQVVHFLAIRVHRKGNGLLKLSASAGGFTYVVRRLKVIRLLE